MDKFGIGDQFGCEVQKGPKSFLDRLWGRIKDEIREQGQKLKRWWHNQRCAFAYLVSTRWHFECYDSQGNLKWVEYDRPNIMTNEGLNFILDVMFHGETNVTKWYLGLVESDTTAAATMTYATPTFTECTAYTGGARPEFDEAAASGQSISNSASKASYTMSDTKTLYGAALFGGGTGVDTAEIPGNTGDAAGVLMCYSKFSSSKEVESSDVFKCWCTITAANS